MSPTTNNILIKKPLSLQKQLLLWLLALSIPLLLIGAISSYYRATYFANLAYDRSLFRAALALADQIEVSQGKVIVDLPQIAKELLEYDKDDIIYYCIRDPNDHPVTGLAEIPTPKISPSPGKHVYYNAKLNEENLRVVAFALPLAGTSAKGVATVYVAETLVKRELMADEIIATMMLPQLLIAIVTGVMVSVGIKRGLAPLEKVRAAFSRRSMYDLSPITEHSAPPELQPLLHSMNDLMQHLRDAIAKQQRFVADASHQLRTPLAGFITQAELALRSDNIDEIKHALHQMQTSSNHLSQMVTQLLSLARAEPEATESANFTHIDFLNLVQTTTSEWVPTAITKQIDLGFYLEQTLSNPKDKLFIMGNSTLLREMLNNLIDNAIRYTQAGGSVTVKLSRTSQIVSLAVTDNGMGIPEQERKQVFERFYRILGTEQEGCGLGLTIVYEIALRHQAKITLEYANELTQSGTKISINFDTVNEASPHKNTV